MPDIKSPPTIQEADLQTVEFILQQKIDREKALALVNQTFSEFESFRSQNHDTRWMEHDQLYAGWLPERKWPGTQTKRSNIPYPIVFDQVEAAVPAIMTAIFNSGADWFDCVAEEGASPEKAREVRDSLDYDFEHNGDYGSTIRCELTLAVRQLLLHGNGGVRLKWDAEKRQTVAEWVNLLDMYFDPGASIPSVDCNRAVIERRRMTSAEIIALGSDTRFNIPSDEVLWGLVTNSFSTEGDVTKSNQEAARKVRYMPGVTDWVPNPADDKGEVLIYTSKTRIIWVLNRQWILYNGPNPYDCIPYFFAPCYTYTGRFYAQSIGDIQQGLQRAIEGYMNAHRDELALRIHPPRVSSRDANLTPQERKFGPGTDMVVGDAQKDVQFIQQQGGLVNIFPDVQFLLSQADTRTGLNGLMNSVPRPSNANRTASGMQMQMSGSMNRLSSIVQNIEDYLIVPMLYAAYKIKQFNVKPEENVPARGEDGKPYQVSGEAYQSKVQFRMVAASKMISREKMMSQVPVIFQYMVSGPVMSEMAKIGQTVNMQEVVRFLMEATGLNNKFEFFRPLTPQEQQTAQQNSPAAVEAQKTQQEAQTKMGIAQMDSQTKLQVAQINKQPDPGAEAILQMEMAAKQKEMEMDQQDRQAEQMMKLIEHKMEMGFKQQEMEMDGQQKQQEMQVKRVETQNNAQLSEVTHQQAMQQMLEKATAQREAAKIAPAPKGAGAPGSAGRPTAASAPSTKKPKKK